jgi:hypothetical protein
MFIFLEDFGTVKIVEEFGSILTCDIDKDEFAPRMESNKFG